MGHHAVAHLAHPRGTSSSAMRYLLKACCVTMSALNMGLLGGRRLGLRLGQEAVRGIWVRRQVSGRQGQGIYRRAGALPSIKAQCGLACNAQRIA